MEGAFEAGDRLGPLRLDERLGTGGMGTVYAGTVRELVPSLADAGLTVDDRVAVKVVHPHLVDGDSVLVRFQREVEYGRRVRHPNVVRSHAGLSVVDADGNPVQALVMELVEGRTLRDYAKELGRVPEELCRHVGAAIASGLAAIHAAGIMHRDVKPENVLITPEHSIKLMDLGVARLMEESVRLSRTGAFVGSILYAAPESFRRGATEPDARVDLYALGLLLYELAGGRHPFVGDDIAQTVSKILSAPVEPLGRVNSQVSPFLEELTKTLYARRPDDRPATAAEVATILEEGEASAWWLRRADEVRTATRRALRRPRVRRDTSVHGRERELVRLTEWFHEAASGDGRVVLLEGEAGIGKSRLVDEFVDRLAASDEDFDFLFGSYAPGADDLQATGVAAALLAHAGPEGVGDLIGEGSPLGVSFAALLQGLGTPEGAPPLTRDSLQTCYVRAVRTLAARRPIVLMVDDLHFADGDELAVWSALTRAVAGHPILLLGTTRPTSSEAPLVQRVGTTVKRLELERLGPKDLARLLVEYLRSDELAEDLAFRIALKSDGNPFFVFEILRGLAEGRYITRTGDGSWVSTRVIERIEIPSSVQDLIAARLADLNEDERELLDLAACIGHEFDPRLLAEACGGSRVSVLRDLGRIERRLRIVRSMGRQFAFDHHQIQEHLYESLPELLREEYHGLVADALLAQFVGEGRGTESLRGEEAVRLCRHLVRGGRPMAETAPLDAALRHLEERHRSAEAVRLIEATLAAQTPPPPARQVELLWSLSTRLERLGRRSDAVDAAERALAVAEQHDDDRSLAIALAAVAWVRMRTGRLEESEREFRRALEIFERIGDLAFERSVVSGLAGVLLSRGRPSEARDRLVHALDLARAEGDPPSEIGVMAKLAAACRNLGERDAALNWIERALSLARRIGDESAELEARGVRFTVLYVGGRHREAEQEATRHAALAKRLGRRSTEALALANLAALQVALGHLERAREQFERYLGLVHEVGERVGEARGLGNLGAVLLMLGRPDEGYELMRRHHELSSSLGEVQEETHALINLSSVEAIWGRFDAAREHAEAALERSRETGYRYGVGYALQACGDVAHQSGDLDAALAAYRESLAERRALSQWDGIGESQVGIATVLLETGHDAEAHALLHDALDNARRSGSAAVRLMATCLLAGTSEGDLEAARQLLAQSEGVVGVRSRLDAHLALFRATGDDHQRDAAAELCDLLVRHTPEPHRDHVRRLVAE